MRSRNFPLGFAAALVALFLGAPSPAVAQQFQVLYNLFGSSPLGGVVFDAAGNLYGTTEVGGTYNYGTVYELSPQGGGVWTQTILHSFNNNFVDGYEPYAGLAIDPAGNLYGTTRAGGPPGQGTVFELAPAGGGVWTETLLHTFGSTSTDGTSPYSPVVLDSAGSLYGTTLGGGTGRSGTVFKLVHGSNGWKEKVIYNFVPDAEGDGGFNPYGGVILDSSGNLYGTTSSCTCSYTNQGTVFELKHGPGGGFAEKVLHYFYDNGVDGYDPRASLAFDAKGNLYGTTQSGGTLLAGTVFELSPTPSGNWKEKVIHNFSGYTTDGSQPLASVTFDTHGNLYSTTYGAGTYGYGIVFELSPATGGTWNEVILHNCNGADCEGPLGAVALDATGNLYSAAGTVFEITP